ADVDRLPEVPGRDPVVDAALVPVLPDRALDHFGGQEVRDRGGHGISFPGAARAVGYYIWARAMHPWHDLDPRAGDALNCVMRMPARSGGQCELHKTTRPRPVH